MDLASKVGGKVINIAELDDFAPEEGMILANATPIGMQPDIDNMPISKVNFSFPYFLFKLFHSHHSIIKMYTTNSEKYVIDLKLFVK